VWIVALIAVGAGVVSFREAFVRSDVAAAAAKVNLAQSLAPGPARDAALEEAQALLLTDDEQPKPRHDDARHLDLLGEVRLMQATNDGVSTVSPTLLGAAVEASARAEALAPSLPGPPERLAYIYSYDSSQAAEAISALRRSFAARPIAGQWSERRLTAASRLWRALDPELKSFATIDACGLSASGGDALTELGALMERSDPLFAGEISPGLQAPECQAAAHS
jgi:hypothetical protein